MDLGLRFEDLGLPDAEASVPSVPMPVESPVLARPPTLTAPLTVVVGSLTAVPLSLEPYLLACAAWLALVSIAQAGVAASDEGDGR